MEIIITSSIIIIIVRSTLRGSSLQCIGWKPLLLFFCTLFDTHYFSIIILSADHIISSQSAYLKAVR